MATGFFTSGAEYRLPHFPLDIRILLIVEEAVRQAWVLLKKDPPKGFHLNGASEKDITLILVRKLEDLRKSGYIDGFNGGNFETVIREGNLANYSGEHPDKEPDLVFRECGFRPGVEYSEQDGVVTECKPIDKKHPVGNAYCKKGLKRFVDGDYAWAMQSGLMIGYVTGNYTIDPKLHDPLEKDKRIYNTRKPPYPCPHSGKMAMKPTVHISIHERTWSYIESGRKAGNIEIRHLWLRI